MKKLIFSTALMSLITIAAYDTTRSATYTRPLDNIDYNYGFSAASSARGVVPTEEEIANGLKEALQLGSTHAADILHAPGGYLNDPIVKIPFPPEVQKVATVLRQHGFGSQVDQFTTSMNRAAEDAAIKAAPIFISAVKTMTLNDAKNILLGADNSATMYFKGKTSGALTQAFSPVIKTSLDKVNATKYWTQITTLYNKIPFVQHVNTDLVGYTTGKALDGVFIKVADEEKKIRSSSAAQVTDNLKKVFGWAKSVLK